MKLSSPALALLTASQLLLAGCHTQAQDSMNLNRNPDPSARLRAWRCGDSLQGMNGHEKKAAASECLKMTLGPNEDSSWYRFVLGELQRAGRWDTAWETELPRNPEVRNIVENRCSNDAKEAIYETAEGVSSVYFNVEGERAFEDIYIETDSSGGLGYSKFWHRLSPLAVEADARRFGDPNRNSQGLPIMMVKNFENPVYRKEQSSTLTVLFKRETRPDEEEKGVYGRTISVIDRRSNKILGERTEFFWMSPPNFRTGIRQRFAICPTVGFKQITPSYFVRKVINPRTFPCFRELSEDYAQLEEDSRREVNRISPESIQKYLRLEKAILEKNHICYTASKAALPPLPD